MEFFGLTPVELTVVICVAGVGFRLLQGMQGKSWRDFNFQLAFSTFFIGVISSIGLVAPVISSIPIGTDSLLHLTVIASQIATVMGIDATVRKGYKKVKEAQIEKAAVTKPLTTDKTGVN